MLKFNVKEMKVRMILLWNHLSNVKLYIPVHITKIKFKNVLNWTPIRVKNVYGFCIS